ncbi:MAG: hypothetical protein AAF694_10555 [Bacteroidota bacterium]
MKTLSSTTMEKVMGGLCPEGQTAIFLSIISLPNQPGLPPIGQYICVPDHFVGNYN